MKGHSSMFKQGPVVLQIRNEKNPLQLLVYNLWISYSCSEILVVNVVIQQSRVANTNIHHRKKHTHNIATSPRMLKGSVILHIHCLFRPTRTSRNISSMHVSGRVNISLYLHINRVSGIWFVIISFRRKMV